MRISKKVWNNYTKKLSMLDDTARDKVEKYIATHDVSTETGLANLIRYSYAVATKYGEGSAALSAQMYDAVAMLEEANVPPAVPAPTATYSETARTVQGARLFSENPEVTAGAVSRLVKTAGADTTLLNAERDGAEFAWVPSGDTCAFCITLASRGWQHMSRRAMEGGHAEHIHNNCDCTYAIRFNHNATVAGYDPEEYRRMYYDAEGTSPEAKINYMRRQFYAKNKGIVGAASKKAEEALLNKNGKPIVFAKTLLDDKHKEVRGVVQKLAGDYKTRLENVISGMSRGGQLRAGNVDMTGASMQLGDRHVDTAIHEFAHTLANSLADKYGLTNDNDFWKEIKKARNQYRKEVGQQTDKWISSYEHSNSSAYAQDEYMAEGFTLAILHKYGLKVPKNYGENALEYAQRVLKIVDKYFKK